MHTIKQVLLNLDNPGNRRDTWNTEKVLCCLIIIAVVLLSIALAGCNKESNKTYTVGVINTVPGLAQTLVGFKEGMTELGYIEGQNIRYIYDGATTDRSKLSAAAQSLVADKVDMILSITTPVTIAAKQVTAGTGLPVVFMIVTDPVGAGIVDSMQRPGGNITGVAYGYQAAWSIQLLVQIAPSIKQIYAPFNPNDQSPVAALKTLRGAAAKLGVELITREIYNPKTLDDAIVNIPADADAAFILPDSLLATRMTDFVKAANDRNLPTSGTNINLVKISAALSCFGIDIYLSGKQTARLADQIFKGTRPADLPVEMGEFYSAINLKTAEAIGLTIPGEILRQTNFIIR